MVADGTRMAMISLGKAERKVEPSSAAAPQRPPGTPWTGYGSPLLHADCAGRSGMMWPQNCDTFSSW